jgi:hypothetical protein
LRLTVIPEPGRATLLALGVFAAFAHMRRREALPVRLRVSSRA